MRAIVIGAGIGGLAVAVALRRVGVDVQVYEQAAELRPIGAGLAIWPNAMAALNAIGLSQAVDSLSVPRPPGAVRDWRGRVLMREEQVVPGGLGERAVVVHRADLQAALLAALDPAIIRPGSRCIGFEERDGGVVALFQNGETARGDLVIGADGLHSAVRAALWGAAQPRYAGYTAWRGVVTFDHAQVVAGETWGCGQRFGVLPISEGRVYWFAAANVLEGAQDAPDERGRELLRRFGAWHAPIPAVLAATPSAAILRNDIYYRRPLRYWGRGRITLLGDAAHPMTPDLGQGACQALEDAAVLGRCLAPIATADEGAAVDAALRAYEHRRQPRAAAVMARSRQIGRVAQWQHPLACKVRNALIRRLPPAFQARQLAWVLDFRLAP